MKLEHKHESMLCFCSTEGVELIREQIKNITKKLTESKFEFEDYV